jgi:sensor histidine kinase YesM
VASRREEKDEDRQPGMALKTPRPKPFFDDKDRAFWILQSVGWSAYFLLRTLSGFSNGVDVLFIVPMAVSTAAGYSLTLLMAACYRRLIDQRPFVTWSLSILVLIFAAILYAVIETQAFITFYRPNEPITAPLFFGALLLNSMLLLGWSALYYGINFYLMLEKQTDQLLHLENQASTAQLAMLRYQLNPHFLFNTLNSISTLVLLKQTERANAMLSRLSSFLRYTLANEPTAQVTLAQEFETLKLYLEIEKMRFEDRLRPSFTLDPVTAQGRLPSLLLQPLVENAIKYAVTPQEEGADINVEARLIGNRVQITVTDTGPGLNAPTPRSIESTGVGLNNIRDRLQQAYGDDHSFEILPATSDGFGVRISIPYQYE